MANTVLVPELGWHQKIQPHQFGCAPKYRSGTREASSDAKPFSDSSTFLHVSRRLFWHQTFSPGLSRASHSSSPFLVPAGTCGQFSGASMFRRTQPPQEALELSPLLCCSSTFSSRTSLPFSSTRNCEKCTQCIFRQPFCTQNLCYLEDVQNR